MDQIYITFRFQENISENKFCPLPKILNSRKFMQYDYAQAAQQKGINFNANKGLKF